MSESKRAAVMKRGADRDHADLFATRPADLGSVKQTLRPPPPDSLHCGVAARNETSVLFTVDALKGAARVKTPEPEQAPLSSAFMVADDEGVIDLNSLASVPPKVGARSVAPLFSEPPPAAFAADVSDSGSMPVVNMGGFKLGKRALAGIAAAAVALVLCSIGLAAAFKGEEPVARTNAVMAPPAPTTPAAAPAAAPVVAPVAAATSTSSSDDDAKSPSIGLKGKGGKAKGAKASSGGKASVGAKASFNTTKVQSSGVAPAPATPKAADKCGCKGDFNCILRCTAKGA